MAEPQRQQQNPEQITMPSDPVLRVVHSEPSDTANLPVLFAANGTPHSLELGRRVRPREIHPGDALAREYRWSGIQAFECRYPVDFMSVDEFDRPIHQWKLACCKTFFTVEQLRTHWLDDHNEELPKEVQEVEPNDGE